jgi:histidyl-tRNA synthetase
VVNAGGGSIKAQMRRADASGARWALIVGDDEVSTNRIALKPLRVAGEQVSLPPEAVADHIGDGSESRQGLLPIADVSRGKLKTN